MRLYLDRVVPPRKGDLPPERTKILSTGSMVDAARELGTGRALVATETGIIHQLQNANPKATFSAVNSAAVCRFMKMTTPERLLTCLREGTFEVTVDEEVRMRALASVQRMIAIGSPSSSGE